MDLGDKLSALELSHHELASVVWGDDKKRDNGLRARVTKMAEVDIPVIQQSITSLKSCVDDQDKKLESHIKEHSENKKDDATIRAEKIRAYGVIAAALLGNAATIATVLLTRGK